MIRRGATAALLGVSVVALAPLSVVADIKEPPAQSLLVRDAASASRRTGSVVSVDAQETRLKAPRRTITVDDLIDRFHRSPVFTLERTLLTLFAGIADPMPSNHPLRVGDRALGGMWTVIARDDSAQEVLMRWEHTLGTGRRLGGTTWFRVVPSGDSVALQFGSGIDMSAAFGAKEDTDLAALQRSPVFVMHCMYARLLLFNARLMFLLSP